MLLKSLPPPYLILPNVPTPRFLGDPRIGVLMKRCPQNMQQIYGRTLMPKCDFIEITFRHVCSPVKLLHILRTFFPKNTSGRLLLKVLDL